MSIYPSTPHARDGPIPIPTVTEKRTTDIVATVERYLSRDSTILDFGAGQCDKTVLVQLRGDRCIAADDFGNPLRQPGFSGNVFEFARSFGVQVMPIDRGRSPGVIRYGDDARRYRASSQLAA